MSITGVFGLAGVGKSTYLSYLAAKALKSKDYQRVYSSFPIHDCYELKWDKLGIEDYSNCLILIDEISLFCDNRNWKDNMTDDMRYFWIMYRHYKCDVVYCSQSYKDCDSKIRDRTDMLYRITRLPLLPVSRVRPVVKTMSLNDAGQWVEAYVERGLGCFVWRPKYYGMFDSFTCKQLKPNTSRLWSDLSAQPDLPTKKPKARRTL